MLYREVVYKVFDSISWETHAMRQKRVKGLTIIAQWNSNT